MMADDVTIDRLGELLAAYGARPDRWPSAERAAALGLLFASREARARRDAAAALDTMLDRVPALAPAPELADRILAGTQRSVRPASRPHRRRPVVAAPGFAGAASLALWLVRRRRGPGTLAA